MNERQFNDECAKQDYDDIQAVIKKDGVLNAEFPSHVNTAAAMAHMCDPAALPVGVQCAARNLIAGLARHHNVTPFENQSLNT